MKTNKVRAAQNLAVIRVLEQANSGKIVSRVTEFLHFSGEIGDVARGVTLCVVEYRYIVMML